MLINLLMLITIVGYIFNLIKNMLITNLKNTKMSSSLITGSLQNM